MTSECGYEVVRRLHAAGKSAVTPRLAGPPEIRRASAVIGDRPITLACLDQADPGDPITPAATLTELMYRAAFDAWTRRASRHPPGLVAPDGPRTARRHYRR